jgi:hypothetical protein
MLPNVKQDTIKPIITAVVVKAHPGFRGAGSGVRRPAP